MPVCFHLFIDLISLRSSVAGARIGEFKPNLTALRTAAKLSLEETGNPEELVKQHLVLFHSLSCLYSPPNL